MKNEATVIAAGTLAVLIFGALSNMLINGDRAEAEERIVYGSYACTTETLMCPDGSTVGRVAPYCHFAECPSAQ